MNISVPKNQKINEMGLFRRALALLVAVAFVFSGVVFDVEVSASTDEYYINAEGVSTPFPETNIFYITSQPTVSDPSRHIEVNNYGEIKLGIPGTDTVPGTPVWYVIQVNGVNGIFDGNIKVNENNAVVNLILANGCDLKVTSRNNWGAGIASNGERLIFSLNLKIKILWGSLPQQEATIVRELAATKHGIAEL